MIKVVILIAVCFVALSAAIAQEASPPLSFEPRRRVNANGDEFNALAKGSDGKRLFVAAEKGDVIVWNIEAGKIEKTLRHPSAVHLVVSLTDPRYLISAGANHHPPRNSFVRKWDIESGKYENLEGLAEDAVPIALSANTSGGLVALGVRDGSIIVWDSRTNKKVTQSRINGMPISLAILKDVLYVVPLSFNFESEGDSSSNVVTALDLNKPGTTWSDLPKVQGRLWTSLEASPDQSLLAATYREGYRERIAILDPASGRDIGNFDGTRASWMDSSSVLFFDGLDPNELVQIKAGKAVSAITFDQFQDDNNYRAFELTGAVPNADGTRVWGSYRKGGALLEFDLKKKTIKTLVSTRVGAYAISVHSADGIEGVVATGGADGYVRTWKLGDLTLLKEHKVTETRMVSDVHILKDGGFAVVSTLSIPSAPLEIPQDPREIVLLNLETGKMKSLFKIDHLIRYRDLALVDGNILYAEGNRARLRSIEDGATIRTYQVDHAIIGWTLSANHKWLAIWDQRHNLYVFDVATAKLVSEKPTNEELQGPIALTNDGQYLYQPFDTGMLAVFNTTTGQVTKHTLTKLRSQHTRSDFISLVDNDRWLVTAGNHGDVGIFDRATLKLLAYERSDDAMFYAEKVWIKGNRMIFTTDTGVMLDGLLVETPGR